MLAELELTTVGAFHFGRQELMPNGRVTDHILDLHVTGASDMSRRYRRAGPVHALCGGGEIEVADDMKIGHAPIVGMPPLPCLQPNREE